VPALVWTVIVSFQSYAAIQRPSPSSVGLVVINTVFLVFFLIRRDATRVGSKTDCVIALSGTFICTFLRGHQLRDTELWPTVIQAVGIIGWAVSLSALGRSLALAAADRGLVTRGPYRYIRHPVYAFEIIFFIGWVIAVPTPWNVAIVSTFCALQVARITREERVLGDYDAYRAAVRWRLIPGVW
jgi:protein-S-isoprenylcysteine O-methyltransferase Ste14